MKLLEYLRPENPIARWIVVALLLLFVGWLILLGWNLGRQLIFRAQINRCSDVSNLRPEEPTPIDFEGPSSPVIARPGVTVFLRFARANRIEGGPIERHLRAIFDAGRTESQLDVRGLIKNTSDELFRTNSLHRSLLSIFIIVGLLGTLFGLADTMASLDSLLHGTKLTNDTLSQGLSSLLGTLRGAFAPSIWGVFLTVVGVLLFAFYLRTVALPLAGLLERMTLTVWVPQLVPTPSQKIRERLQLSREQMERAIAASDHVNKHSEEIQSKTGSLLQTLDRTTDAFKQMSEVAERLDTFSRRFEAGVNALVPFQSDLRSLYQQMKDESRAFQDSVQRNISGSEEFQQRIQVELNSQHQQLVEFLSALRSYESSYVKSREGIDRNLADVLVKAEQAFGSLSQRNEEITRSLDEVVGKPLRDNLARDLVAIGSQLGGVTAALEVHSKDMAQVLGRLDKPLNEATKSVTDTFSNFDYSVREWLKTIQTEFNNQNNTNQAQLKKLESLSQQIPELLQKLTTSSDNFSESSKRFADHGQQLSQGTGTLSETIRTLSQVVDVINQHLSTQVTGTNHRAAQVLAKQTKILQELRKKIESQRGRS
jgi:methyl-accepting chemotaxis protein